MGHFVHEDANHMAGLIKQPQGDFDVEQVVFVEAGIQVVMNGDSRTQVWNQKQLEAVPLVLPLPFFRYWVHLSEKNR